VQGKVTRIESQGKWVRDGQVKIRGFRVEVGEIESVLERQGSIRSAVVTARANGDGEKELVAYIVGSEEMNLTEVQWYLRRELPSYMIPVTICGWKRCR
jgi:surfactin family lipopeptide synthetase A